MHSAKTKSGAETPYYEDAKAYEIDKTEDSTALFRLVVAPSDCDS